MPSNSFYRSRRPSAAAVDPTPQQEVISQEQQAVQRVNMEAEYSDLVRQEQRQQESRQADIEAEQKKAETARKAQIAAQKRAGVETQYDEGGREDIKRHDDGTPVYKSGFLGKPEPDETGSPVATFRDPRGARVKVPLDAINRTTDPTGQTFYEFDLNGEKIRRPESTTNPLYKVDPATGRRYSEVQDPATGSFVQQPLGIDKRAANVAAITRKKADYDKLKQQRTFETQNLDMERTTSATNFEPVREKFTAAQTEAKKFQRGRRYEQTPDGLVSIDRNNGEDFRSPVSSNDTAEIAKANAWLNSKKTADATLEAARAEHDPAKKRLYDLEVKRNTLAEQALRESQRHQTELADMEEATKAGLDITKPQWKATLDFARKDPRYQQIVAAGEYADQGSDLASAINAAVAKVKAPNYVEAREEPLSIAQRVLRDLSANAPRENYVDPNAAPDTARMEAEGEKRALVDAIAAGITTGKPAPDAKDMATASDIAAKSLGVTDPEKWSLTPSSMGDFDLHHADSDMVVGRLDPENKRILLYPSATLGEAGKQLMEKASRDGFPVYHMGSSEAPMTPQELRDYVANGINIARMAGTQDERDAALEQAGITAADVREKVMSGRMSVQDGQWLNEKLFEVRELDNSPEGYTKGFREYIGSNPEAAKIMQGGTPEMKAAVVNRYADARARSTGNNLFLDRDTLADRRMELEQQVAGKGKLAKAGAFVKETLAPMLGIFGQAGAYIPQKIAKWSGNETTAGRLSEQQFEDWMKRTPSYLDRINKRPEVQFAVDEFRQWAVRARPGETPPDELASKIAREVYAGYHQLTDETAKALDTTEDTFNVNKDPVLSAALQRYLETANPAAFQEMTSLMVMDARDRKTQGEVMQYVERPHAATPADVAARAKELNLPMTEGAASTLLGLSKNLDAAKDPKQIEAIITQAGKLLKTTTRDDTLLALHTLTTQATDDPQSWWGLMKGGFVAGREELLTELVSTGAEAGIAVLTAGAATPEILAAKAARRATQTGIRAAVRRTASASLAALTDESKLFAATRGAIGRARTKLGTAIAEEGDKFAAAGILKPKFGQPLTALQKARNAAVTVGKGIVAAAPIEAAEEGIAAIGDADPTLESTFKQMGMGAVGAGLITPIFVGSVAIRNAFRARGATAEYEKQKAGWVAKFNERMSGAPGFKPITTADFDTWQALQGNPAHQAAAEEYAGAIGELQAAGQLEEGRSTDQIDREYAEALIAGDVAKQQALIDEAAKAAGRRELYHGSSTPYEGEKVFEDRNTSSGADAMGIYMSPDLETASGYGQVARYWVDAHLPGFDEFNNGLSLDDISAGRTVPTQGDGTNAVWRNHNGTIEIVVRKADQIGSSSPVVFDESGNPVPPSKRFPRTQADPIATVAAQARVEAASEHLAGLSEVAFQAADELRAIPEAERPLYTGAAKAAAGATDFTADEAKALIKQSGVNAVAFKQAEVLPSDVQGPRNLKTLADLPDVKNVAPSVYRLPAGVQIDVPAPLLDTLRQAAPSMVDLVGATQPMQPTAATVATSGQATTPVATNAPSTKAAKQPKAQKGTVTPPVAANQPPAAAQKTAPKPAAMTPEQWVKASSQPVIKGNYITFQGADGETYTQALEGQDPIEVIKGAQNVPISLAYQAGEPVSAATVEANKIKTPEGWTRVGDFYVPPAKPPAKAAKTAPAKQPPGLEQLARRVIGETVAKSPKLKALVKESKKGTKQASGGMWFGDGAISYHMGTLLPQLEGLDAQTAAKRVAALLDEEIRHAAQFEAAKRLWKAGNSNPLNLPYADWADAWYSDIWDNHFTPEMRAKVEEAYGDTLPPEKWARAMEGLRMIDQLRATGSITEAVLRHLEAVIEALKEFLTAATPTIKREIENIKAVLEEYGYEAGEVKPEKAKKQPAQPKAKVAKNSNLAKGTVVRSNEYKSEGDITLTSEARTDDQGEVKYDAYFSGTMRGGVIAAKHITTVAKKPKSTPKSSTQFTLKPEDAKPIIDFAASIPDDELAPDSAVPGAAGSAREDEPHVTVLYGLTEHDAAPVQKVIADHGPVTLTLGKLSVFANDEYDVLKVDVESPSLRALNAKIAKLPNENSFPDYKPHMTVAYLKKGEGAKYVGDTRFEGKELTFDTMTFSPPSEMRKELGRPELALTKTNKVEIAPTEIKDGAGSLESPEAPAPFDSEAFNQTREDTIKASKKAGNTHLDQLTPSVETMRGKVIYYAHDPKQRGVIRTVDNSGNVYVHWSDEYSAGKELASETVEDNRAWLKSSSKLPYLRRERGGKVYVMASTLGKTDLKDYVLEQPAKPQPDSKKEAAAETKAPEAPTIGEPAKSGPPSLGATGKEIWQAWQSFTGTNVMPGHIVEATLVDGGGEFSFGPEGLQKVEKFKQRDKTVIATARKATPDEIEAVHDAIDRGTIQIEERVITGAGGMWAREDGGSTRRVLHQATGKPLAEWLETPAGKRWTKRNEEYQRKADEIQESVPEPSQPQRTGYHKRLFENIDSAKANGLIPYVVVRRAMPEGKMQWEAYSPEGEKIAEANTVSSSGSISDKLSRRKDRYTNVVSFDIMAQQGDEITFDWIEAQVKEADAALAKAAAEGEQRVKDEAEAARKAGEGDPNIGREWDSPYGRQKIVGVSPGGGSKSYDVETIGEGTIRRYGAERIDDVIQKDEYRLTPAYKQELEERAARAEREQQAQAKAAQEKEGRDAITNRYLDSLGLKPINRGRIKLALDAPYEKRASSKTYKGDRASIVREMVADGYKPVSSQVPAIKELTGQQMNRMDNRQQAEHERKRREAGMKTEYMLALPDSSGFLVTRIEYDYAKWLMENDTRPQAPKADTPATAEAKVEGQIQDVAESEGRRDAREVKKEIIEKLEAAIAKLPPMESAADAEMGIWTWKTAGKMFTVKRIKKNRGTEYVLIEDNNHVLTAWKGSEYTEPQAIREAYARLTEEITPKGTPPVTFHIPGDGNFKLIPTRANLEMVLKRVKALPTRFEGGVNVPEGRATGEATSAKDIATNIYSTEAARPWVINAINGDEWAQKVVEAMKSLKKSDVNKVHRPDIDVIEDEVRANMEASPTVPASIPQAPAPEQPASNPPASDQQDNEAKAAKYGIADFGEKLGGARKDKVATVEQELTDDEIAGKTLSEIWPKSEIDSIEDIDKAAFATAIRDEIPTKPQRGYKLRAWVEKVKFVKGLMRHANEKGVAEMLDIMRGPQYNLASFADKITLLQAVEREQWGRIGKVEHHPNAYRYGEGATKIPSPHATAEVDGRLIREETLEKLTEAVSAKVSEGKPVAKMQFEVRGRAGAWGINKKGDPLYRKLKTFEDSKEAIEFVKNNHADLVAAWEAVKERDNIKETDLRKSTNRPRTAEDYRQNRDATPEMFQEAFGFRGVEFGNWVSQGANAKERQGMMNEAYDALHDLASILNIPTRALSLDGQIGLGFGSRGQGWASAHYEPGNLVINLTKTRGAGSLAHELFHAFDHYFQRQRGVSIANGRGSYITEQPETRYVDQTTGHTLSVERFNQIKERGRFRNEADWKLMEGVRPEVEEAFTALVKALDESPMAKRASLNDKGKQGYWGSVIERAARSFENYVIYKMQQKGYQNDYLANVVRIEEFARDPGRYPYLLDEEIEPVAKAFDDLFATIKTKETEKGIALYSAPSSMPRDRAESIVRNLGKVRAVRELRPDEARAFDEAQARIDFDEGAGSAPLAPQRPKNRPPTTHIMPDGYELTEPGMHTLSSAPAPLRAYHGTPHKVDKFTTAKIGTGEGAQAYGWGLYFAENREVAEQYKTTLGKVEKYRALGFNPTLRVREYMENFASQNHKIEWMREDLDGSRLSELRPDEIAEIEKFYSYVKENGYPKTPGAVYTVELLGDSEAFLDWDRPLSEQSEKVKAALAPIVDQWKVGAERRRGTSWDTGAEWEFDPQRQNGQTYYIWAADRNNDPQSASKRLASLGVQGIRYLDGGSRRVDAPIVRKSERSERWVVSWDANGIPSTRSFESEQEAQDFKKTIPDPQTYNYVIFDESLVRILEENGRPVEAQSVLASAPSPSLASAPAQNRDAEYMAAVEAGDMEKAQRMVDAAAKAAGYDVGPVYHGTEQEGLTEFFGGWWSDQKATTKEFGRQMYSAFLRGPLAFAEDLRPLYVEFNGTDVDPDSDEAISDSDLGDAAMSGGPFSRFVQEKGFQGIAVWDESNAVTGMAYAVFNPNQIKSADPVTRDEQGNVIPLSQRFNPESNSILYAAPSPKKPKDPKAAAMRQALDSMQPLWRDVIESVVQKGEPIEAFAKRKHISLEAAGNVLRYASGRLRVLMAAADKTLKPTVQVEGDKVKAASGRPDLAFSGNPAFVAVDQRRSTPEEVTHGEMEELAQRLFASDAVAAEKLVVRWMDSGTTVLSTDGLPSSIKAIVDEAQARSAAEMLMTAAAKLLVTEKSLSGGDLIQTARLIDLYRTTGTEQARALGMRYDPHTSPEERNAMYIQEALLTPPQSMRNEMKRNPANKLRILAEWARRAEALKEQLKAEGFDLDATFAEYRKEQKLAEATVPQEVRIPLSRAPGKTRKLIKAVLEGKTWGEAAEAAKLTFADARKAYNAFRDTINQAGVKAAQQAKDVLLRSAPAPGDFAAQLGLPEWLEHASPDYAPTKNKATEELKKERKRPKKAGTVDLNNPVAVARATRKIAIAKSTAFDAMSEFWRASILSGPQTHVVNFVSAALYGTYETTFKKLATGTMGDIARMFGMQSDAASLSDLPAMMAATFPAIQEAFRDGIRSLKTDTRTFEAYARGPQPDGSTFKGDVYDPALGGLLGKVMRGISFRAMTAADELVKSFFTRIEVAAQARQIARSEGLTGKAMADRIAVLLRPGSEAWIRALDHAHQITFQTELKTHNRAIDQLDGLANIVSRAKKGDFGSLPKGISHFIFPFVATPANIFKTGLTMSPLGALLSIIDAARAYDQRRKGNEQEAARIFNAARLLDDLANQIVAWGALYALSSLVKPGEDDDDLPFVTGTMPWTSTAKGERDLAYRTAPPLSIRVGDRWYSYKRLDPFASALSFMVDAVKELQSGKPIEESWASIAGSVLRNTQEKTFLQGFGDLMNMLHDPQRYGSRWATNIATGFVPNLIRQPIRSADPYIRESDLPNDMGFWSALGHRVGYGIYPQAAMPKVDVWGNPASKDTGTGGPLTDTLLRLFSPIDTRDGSQPDPLDVALFRFNATHDENQFAATAPRREIQRTRGSTTVRFSLNDAEYNDMAAQSGQAARRALGGGFNRELNEADVKKIKAVIEKYHEIAVERAFRRKISEMAKP